MACVVLVFAISFNRSLGSASLYHFEESLPPVRHEFQSEPRFRVSVPKKVVLKDVEFEFQSEPRFRVSVPKDKEREALSGKVSIGA